MPHVFNTFVFLFSPVHCSYAKHSETNFGEMTVFLRIHRTPTKRFCDQSQENFVCFDPSGQTRKKSNWLAFCASKKTFLGVQVSRERSVRQRNVSIESNLLQEFAGGKGKKRAFVLASWNRRRRNILIPEICSGSTPQMSWREEHGCCSNFVSM